MPKSPSAKLSIRLDLLKPQSNPEKLLTKLLRWLLSSGRYIFIFVEAVMLLAFIARFKLDADKIDRKEAIEEQIPYIESLKPVEVSIRQTQLKLSTINSFYSNYTDFSQVLKKIANQTPSGVKVTSLNLQKNVAKISIQLNAQAQTNNDLASFLAGLKQDSFFSDVNVTNIGFEQGNLNFSLTVGANTSSSGGKKL